MNPIHPIHRPIRLRQAALAVFTARAWVGLCGLLSVWGLSSPEAWAQAAPGGKAASPAKPTVAEVIAAAPDAHWRGLDAAHTLVMELGVRPSAGAVPAPAAPVVIELAPRFAPAHVQNILKLVRQGYFDGLAVIRSQDNYVAQWGEADDVPKDKAKPIEPALKALPAEFSTALKGLPLSRLPETDGWSTLNGFVDGFPVAADVSKGRAWLAHCYATVGAGRDQAPDSSNGSSLYAVTGHSPRGLDLNITTVGRVVSGMGALSSLPRGTLPLGFYATAPERTPIVRVRVMADMPLAEQPQLQVMRTESASFAQLLQARRVRQEKWFAHSHGRIDLCTAGVPTRERPAPGP
jgi:cyclophilin family peptidyl-prolyl cis-trans isomerase